MSSAKAYRKGGPPAPPGKAGALTKTGPPAKSPFKQGGGGVSKAVPYNKKQGGQGKGDKEKEKIGPTLNCSLGELAAIIREYIDVEDESHETTGGGRILDLILSKNVPADKRGAKPFCPQGGKKGDKVGIITTIGSPSLPAWFPQGVVETKKGDKTKYDLLVALPTKPYSFMPPDQNGDNFSDLYNQQMREAETAALELIKRRWKSWEGCVFAKPPTPAQLEISLDNPSVRFNCLPCRPKLDNDEWRMNNPRFKGTVNPAFVNNDVNEKGYRTGKFATIKRFLYNESSGVRSYDKFDPDDPTDTEYIDEEGNPHYPLESVVDIPPGSCGMVKISLRYFFIDTWTRLSGSINAVYCLPGNLTYEQQEAFDGIDQSFLDKRAERKKAAVRTPRKLLTGMEDFADDQEAQEGEDPEGASPYSRGERYTEMHQSIDEDAYEE